MSILNNSLLLGADAGAGGYQVSRSIRLNASDSAYLSRTPASAGNRKTWTWSGWVKRSGLGPAAIFCATRATSTRPTFEITFGSGDILALSQYNGSGYDIGVNTLAAFRDLSAWYHLVVALDTTQATDTNRAKIYVNGALQATSGGWPALNADLEINNNVPTDFGRNNWIGTTYFNGYLADIHFIDGQALTPSSFAETNATTGQWVPKAYTGSYGTNNGFRLDFSDNSAATATTLGKDRAGSNNWTPNNFSVLTGSAVPIASATGGQPIHNTTDTFGATIGTGVRADANASTLVLAAPLTTAGANSLSDDESPTGRTSSIKTLTANGSIASSTSVSRYYGGAALFSSTGYYALSGSDFTFGTGNFTIEAWVYNPSGSEGSLFATHPNSLAATTFNSRFYGSSPRIDIYTSGGGEYMSITGIPVDQWIHVAMCRSGGTTMRLFINGTLRGTSNGWGMSLSDTEFFINAGRDVRIGNRYYQDVRVYKGLAKYSSDFAVPNAASNPTVGAGCDSLVDTPTSYGTDTGAGGEVRGNYATWNPLVRLGTSSLSNGNLDALSTGPNNSTQSTIAVTTGKWYAEFVASAQNFPRIGIQDIRETGANMNSSLTISWGAYNAGELYINGVDTPTGGNIYLNGDVIGVAFDADTRKVWFSKNGTWVNFSGSGANPATGTNPVGTLAGTSAIAYAVRSESCTVVANFGQRPFAYTAPSGFKALCDTNLPAPTIARPSTVFNTVIWTGNGTTGTGSITGVGFQPDFVWSKIRSGSGSFNLNNSIVGGGSNKSLASNNAESEASHNSNSTFGYLSSFDSDGFSYFGGSTPYYYSGNGNAYVAWCWDAGSSTVTNTQGSITSQVRTNGYLSIVTYTGNGIQGATVGHGLGVPPGMVIYKSRDGSLDWLVYHSALGATQGIYLNQTLAAITSANFFNNTAPNSTTLYLNSAPPAGQTNTNGNRHVAYCFAPVAGYSAFGSYTGNGSADGPFVFTGFKPRWVIFKRSDAVGSWGILDTVRNTFNVSDKLLWANLSDAEGTYTILDVLSNGFKLRESTNGYNTSSGTYIYAAFAESPFQYARAR